MMTAKISLIIVLHLAAGLILEIGAKKSSNDTNSAKYRDLDIVYLSSGFDKLDRYLDKMVVKSTKGSPDLDSMLVRSRETASWLWPKWSKKALNIISDIAQADRCNDTALDLIDLARFATQAYEETPIRLVDQMVRKYTLNLVNKCQDYWEPRFLKLYAELEADESFNSIKKLFGDIYIEGERNINESEFFDRILRQSVPLKEKDIVGLLKAVDSDNFIMQMYQPSFLDRVPYIVEAYEEHLNKPCRVHTEQLDWFAERFHAASSFMKDYENKLLLKRSPSLAIGLYRYSMCARIVANFFNPELISQEWSNFY